MNERIFSLVEQGELEIVKWLLPRYGRHNFRGYASYDILCLSIFLKQTEMTKLLLSSGAEVNYRKSYSHRIIDSNTPLHFAAQNGDTEIVKLLLQYGAEVRATNDDYWTPLETAVSIDSEEVVDLLTKGRPKHELIIGFSPLHVAIGRGFYKMTEKLLQLGIDVNYRHCFSELSPLSRAVKTGNKAIVQLLLKYGAKVELTNDDGLTPMHAAAEKGNVEIIKLLLSRNADANAGGKNMFTVTPLYLALKHSHKEAAKYLMAHGATIEGEFKNEETVIIKNLLDDHFSVNPNDINNTVLLHTAISMGNIQIIQDLIKHGLDFSCYKKENVNILHIATKYNRVEIAKLLLTNGANILVNAPDKAGKPAIYYSTKNSYVDMTRLLLSHGANVKKSLKPLWIAIEKGCKEIVELLIQSKIDIEATDEYETTALLYSAEINKEEIVKWLLSMGANVNAKTNTPITVVNYQIDH